MGKTTIEWTARRRRDGSVIPGYTFNPWWGCTRVSPGCVNCYAETFDRRVHGKGNEHWGVKAERRFFGDKHWNAPLRWNAAAEKTGERRAVFCASMADVFEDRPELVPHRARLLLLILNTPHLDWLLLTKRPENMTRLASEAGWEGDWPANVWAGCTVESQEYAEYRVPRLLDVPASVRFLSCEPLLGAVDLTRIRLTELYQDKIVPPPMLDSLRGEVGGAALGSKIDWVICGGESGPHARPMHPAWALSLRDQCVNAATAFHFKQWGEYAPALPAHVVRASEYFVCTSGHAGRLTDEAVAAHRNGERNCISSTIMVHRLGKHDAGRLIGGRTWDEHPMREG